MTAIRSKTGGYVIPDIDIALIGASAPSHGQFLKDLSRAASKHRMGTPFSHSLGAFAAACDYVTSRKTLDLVHIGNSTCLASTDLADGCAKLAKILKLHPNRPSVVIDRRLVLYSVAFTQLGIRYMGNDLIAAIVSLYETRLETQRRRA